MSKVNTGYLYTICMLAGLLSLSGQAMAFSFGTNNMPMPEPNFTANRPWGNFDGTKAAPQYQPPQPPPGNFYPGGMPADYPGAIPADYPGAMPGNDWYAAQVPDYAATGNGTPVVEVELGDSVLYQQQNVVYTVRIVSDGNIRTLKAELPRIEGAVLEHLSGPVVGTRTSARTNRQQIVNTYRYKLMPLREGRVVIPPIRFTGTLAQDRQARRALAPREFSIAAQDDLTIQVRPAEPGVNPWLPLHDLKLTTNLAQEGPATAGKPVTLTVELKAKGALGNQLPSLAAQLESASYRIYRDATEVQNGISANGRYLTGTRKETYSIIPLEDGWIRIPGVTVAWWDVDSETARQAGTPFGESDAASAGSAAAVGLQGEQSLFPVYFWIPMIVTLSLIAGFWLGSWHRTRPLVRAAAGWASRQGQGAMQFVQHAGARLSPVSHLKRLYMGFALLMPKSVRIWMCARCLLDEDDPETWCTQFRNRVCGHLQIAAQAPLTHVTEKLIQASPQARPARLRHLTHSLDRAIYGGKTLDFPAWKREFMEQLRPRPLGWRRSRARRDASRLPALNPRSAA